MYPNEMNMILVPNHKNNGDYYEYPSLSLFTINFNDKEKGGKKSFSCRSKHQYRASKFGEHDCSAHNEKNRYYYEYPILTQFTDES